MSDYKVERLSEHLYALRADDMRTKYFEALWEIPEGITYNVYLLVDDEARVLFDGWPKELSEEFLEAISEVVNPEEITHVVVHHMEPDHSGTIPVIEEKAKNATFYAHPMALGMMKAMYSFSGKFHPVKDGEEIPLGQKTLRFLYTPWIHWPETIMSYLSPDEVLFSGDAFGSFGIPSKVFDDEEKVPYEYVRKYLITIVGHYLKFVSKAFEKLDGISISGIAPLHGTVWRKDPKEILEEYKRIISGIPEEKVTLIYSSMYGFVSKAMEFLRKEIEERGYDVKEFEFSKKGRSMLSEAISEASDSKAIVLGIPTYEGKAFPIMAYVARLLAQKIPFPRKVMLIGVYGWGEMGTKEVEEILSQGAFQIKAKVRIRGSLTEKEKEELRRGVEEILS